MRKYFPTQPCALRARSRSLTHTHCQCWVVALRRTAGWWISWSLEPRMAFSRQRVLEQWQKRAGVLCGGPRPSTGKRERERVRRVLGAVWQRSLVCCFSRVCVVFFLLCSSVRCLFSSTLPVPRPSCCLPAEPTDCRGWANDGPGHGRAG